MQNSPLNHSLEAELTIASLDILPNPVLIKDDCLNYVWVNEAFETLFNVKRNDLVGKTDTEIFRERQAVQCNGGDRRVLDSGEVDEAYETVFKNGTEKRETLTRKNRLVLTDGRKFLVGVMHDITDVVLANRELEKNKQLLEKQSDELRHMAHTDVLTNCMNRRALFEFASSYTSPLDTENSILILDIDFFKKINDQHGHDAGDAALKHFVNLVKGQLRSSDKLARIGGEEFAILLLNASPEKAVSVGERIRRHVEKSTLVFNSKTIKMTVSIGAISSVARKTIHLEELLSQADMHLYQAKEQGRNRLIGSVYS